MCFYCKAYNSRYMQYRELLFDKVYKYKIRNYKQNMIYSCDWYINFNCDREGDQFTGIYLYENGTISYLKWQPNGKPYRNYDKPTCIDFNYVFEVVYNDRIRYLAWRHGGKFHREENKPCYIHLHFNGNIWKLEWYCNGVPLHINKLHNLRLNENGDIN